MDSLLEPDSYLPKENYAFLKLAEGLMYLGISFAYTEHYESHFRIESPITNVLFFRMHPFALKVTTSPDYLELVEPSASFHNRLFLGVDRKLYCLKCFMIK